ncbi:MAG: hypothetical protein HQK53_16520, partial [Oligoflexia bacterium]|nr:hypothetical protein [Oligoflexia bacterium]
LFALLLGVASAASIACCTLPTLGILLGYSGAQVDRDRRMAIRFVLLFTFGIILSLIIIGGIAGFVGQIAQNTMGRYWKVFAGFVAIIFGLATFKLFPFRLPAIDRAKMDKKTPSFFGTTMMGILLGGGVAASSLPCNPGIFIVLGAALLQGQVIWAMLLLLSFAIGFGLPIGAILLGISLGKTFFVARKTERVIRNVSGAVLLVTGFYLLISL